MLVSTSLLLGALPFTLAVAQYGSPKDAPSSSATPTATALASSSTHTIEVGKSGLSFEPNTTTAAVGDTIVFDFYPQNHSVTQSSFEKPCEPLSSTSFFSGFMATSSKPDTKTFTIAIENTDPIWFYCSQNSPVDHCKAGMVGVINPP
ncbi:Cupredoxin [Mytilinidion resinicola]|uniref:Cupredoxin n=1 Tax=Mytilinidion resinicola TaxID=574789 RepID=A0A6A6YFE0_9PEZI|nr:Cupredoxin [Mytilinidion resinicola]KAF2806587.1 Cupredoxin [Mytilinidion resinicola]